MEENSEKSQPESPKSSGTSENQPQTFQETKREPMEALSMGLLAQFTCLRSLEQQLELIVESQKGLMENLATMNEFYAQNQELQEVQLMMRKMNLYRMKLKKIRSDMLYIKSTTQSLLQKAIELQTIKVNQKAEQVKRCDYEIGLIAKSKQQS